MIYGYALLIVLALYVLYRILASMGILPSGNGGGGPRGPRGPKPKPKPKPFNVNELSPAELRLKYRLNFATAVNFERNGAASGISKSEAQDAVDKLILIRHRLDKIEEKIPADGGGKTLDDYRNAIMTDVKDAAEGGQA